MLSSRKTNLVTEGLHNWLYIIWYTHILYWIIPSFLFLYLFLFVFFECSSLYTINVSGFRCSFNRNDCQRVYRNVYVRWFRLSLLYHQEFSFNIVFCFLCELFIIYVCPVVLCPRLWWFSLNLDKLFLSIVKLQHVLYKNH